MYQNNACWVFLSKYVKLVAILTHFDFVLIKHAYVISKCVAMMPAISKKINWIFKIRCCFIFIKSVYLAFSRKIAVGSVCILIMERSAMKSVRVTTQLVTLRMAAKKAGIFIVYIWYIPLYTCKSSTQNNLNSKLKAVYVTEIEESYILISIHFIRSSLT